MRRLFFLGVPVDDVTIDDAVQRLDAFLDERIPRQVATINPEFVMAAQRLPQFKHVLNAADLCVPDGVGLEWGARLLRRRLRGRVPGVDLVVRLAALAEQRGSSLFLL